MPIYFRKKFWNSFFTFSFICKVASVSSQQILSLVPRAEVLLEYLAYM